MHSSTALLLTFIASASAAVDYMAIPHVRRELNLLPRATPINEVRADDDPSKCASAALSFVQAMPTPPPDLLSDIATNTQTDACKFTFPSSLSAKYSSYSSEVLSWYDDHKDELTSLASECSMLQSYTDIVDVCTDGDSSGSSGPNTANAAPTGSKTAGSDAKSTNAGAARETGIAIAAFAAAGIAAIL
ncbi:hypothetical protein V8C42DRAFT_334736 [Trichoderma barbatum]